MPKEAATQDKKEFIIDVKKVVDKYNSDNPDKKPLTQKELAKQIGVSETNLTKWRTKGPDVIAALFSLMRIGKCNLNYFVEEKK